MVIYWFGHVADLSTDRDVFITHTFPRAIELPGGLDAMALARDDCVFKRGHDDADGVFGRVGHHHESEAMERHHASASASASASARASSSIRESSSRSHNSSSGSDAVAPVRGTHELHEGMELTLTPQSVRTTFDSDWTPVSTCVIGH